MTIYIYISLYEFSTVRLQPRINMHLLIQHLTIDLRARQSTYVIYMGANSAQKVYFLQPNAQTMSSCVRSILSPNAGQPAFHVWVTSAERIGFASSCGMDVCLLCVYVNTRNVITF